MNTPSDFVPPAGFPFPNAYSRTKHHAEQAVLNANVMGNDEGEGEEGSTFATCALRFPGIYGADDPLMIGPFLDGGIDSVPAGAATATMDVIYVENAAHAHCLAVTGLLNNS